MVTGAVFATSALTGILGLFQSLDVRTADGRLVTTGYRRLELAAARLATIAATALLVAAATTFSLDWSVSGHLESLAFTTVGLFLAGVLYGLLGVFVGSVLPRQLEESLVLIALADVSAIVASGLFDIGGGLDRFFPLSHPHDIVMEAAVKGSATTSDALAALGYIVVVALLTAFGYVRILPAGGEGA